LKSKDPKIKKFHEALKLKMMAPFGEVIKEEPEHETSKFRDVLRHKKT
jgi:CRISPR/Cas system endoribonuclease Cas6 (RAMP superfamily)